MASKRVLLALLFAILMVLSLTTLMKIYDKDRITNDQKKADREIKREKMRAELDMGKRHDAKMKKKIIETLDRIPNNDIDSYTVKAENLLVTCIKSDNNVTQPLNSDRKRRGVPDKCLNLATHLLGSVPLSDNNNIPQLRSKPGAANRVHLDFDGYTIQDTAWNVNQDPIIEAAPYGNGTLPFSFDIRDEIFEIWCGIAEDFMPFDLDVTTIDPGIINATTGKILFTPKDGIRSCNCGGVAYRDIWGLSYPDWWMKFYQPALVFEVSTRGGLEAGSHELGHNLGLSHDNTSTDPYYQGDQRWAPIMGNSYRASMATFDAGSYPGAKNQEDDIAIIKESLASTSNSNGFRADEAEITIMTNATFVGVINFRDGNNNVSEEDVFEYTITGTSGQVSIDVGPYLTENYNGKFGLSVNFNGQTITRNNACKRDEASSRILLNTSDVVGKLTITVRSSIPDEGLITTASQLSGTYILSVDENPTLMGTTDCGETPVNCSGSFGDYSACSVSCGNGTHIRVYTITTAAENFGILCNYANNFSETTSCSNSCSTTLTSTLSSTSTSTFSSTSSSTLTTTLSSTPTSTSTSTASSTLSSTSTSTLTSTSTSTVSSTSSSTLTSTFSSTPTSTLTSTTPFTPTFTLTSTLSSTISSTLSSTSTSTLTSTSTSTFSSTSSSLYTSIEDDSNNMNLIIGIASGGVVLVGFIFVVSFKSSICLPSAAGYKLTTNTNP